MLGYFLGVKCASCFIFHYQTRSTTRIDDTLAAVCSIYQLFLIVEKDHLNIPISIASYYIGVPVRLDHVGIYNAGRFG